MKVGPFVSDQNYITWVPGKVAKIEVSGPPFKLATTAIPIIHLLFVEFTNVSHSFITMFLSHLFYMPRRCYFPQFTSARPFSVYGVFEVSLLLAWWRTASFFRHHAGKARKEKENHHMANIFETARADRRANKFSKGLNSAAQLAQTLSGPGPFTIFVPTDAAFDQPVRRPAEQCPG